MVNTVGVTAAYKEMMGKFSSIPFASAQSLNLDNYVTDKAISGLFLMLAEEEKKIKEIEPDYEGWHKDNIAAEKKRLAEENVANPKKTNIIGYPKFDNTIDIKDLGQKLFRHNRKIVYYAPHWEPTLASYKKYAHKIMEYFKNDDRYNLIFAPHTLLKHWSHKYNYNMDFHSSDNIHVDFGSRLSTDTSYVQLADYFIGDVSSLIYEWIGIRPRPAVFLNAHDVDWKNNIDYRHWEYGPVIDDIDNLLGAMEQAVQPHWLKLQAERVKEYMDTNEQSPSKRAALAIMNRLEVTS